MSFLAFKGITKRFPGVLALAGVYVADEGEIQLDGQTIHTPNPLAARKLGIAMVHQELAFCPNLTVAENLCLGDLPNHAGWLDRRRMRQQARAMLKEIETEFDVDLPISRLSTGQEQLVQIAAALGTQAKVIVM